MATFKWLIRFRIIANLLLVAFVLWKPDVFLELLRFTEPGVPTPIDEQRWAQALAIAYLFMTVAYIPSSLSPTHNMMSNLVVVLSPILPTALLFWLAWKTGLSGGFIWIAAYELAWALLLNTTFKRGYIAELMEKP